ncbi:uncharacterized protein BCR38DRAFT_338993, partial [Pseudomassariella vexata]
RAGEAKTALAYGFHLLLGLKSSISYRILKMLSPDGKFMTCKFLKLESPPHSGNGSRLLQ